MKIDPVHLMSIEPVHLMMNDPEHLMKIDPAYLLKIDPVQCDHSLGFNRIWFLSIFSYSFKMHDQSCLKKLFCDRTLSLT